MKSGIPKAIRRARSGASESVGDFEIERLDGGAQQRISLLQGGESLDAHHLVRQPLRWRGRRCSIPAQLDTLDVREPLAQLREQLTTAAGDRVRVEVVGLIELD